MSYETVLLSKVSPDGTIILAKEQFHTFWAMPILIFSPVQMIMTHPLFIHSFFQVFWGDCEDSRWFVFTHPLRVYVRSCLRLFRILWQLLLRWKRQKNWWSSQNQYGKNGSVWGNGQSFGPMFWYSRHHSCAKNVKTIQIIFRQNPALFYIISIPYAFYYNPLWFWNRYRL